MSRLPAEFADLERFTDWCLPTEQERYTKRLNSTMAEMQQFYLNRVGAESHLKFLKLLGLRPRGSAQTFPMRLP